MNAPAYLCIRLYYYNETSTINYNTLKQVSIQGFRHDTSYDASANFSLFAQPSTLTMGGPDNLNEGALVVYTIIGR